MHAKIIWCLALATNPMRIPLILGVIYSLCLPSALMAADLCQKRHPEVSLRYSIKPTRYVRNVSAKELTQGRSEQEEGHRVLGACWWWYWFTRNNRI